MTFLYFDPYSERAFSFLEDKTFEYSVHNGKLRKKISPARKDTLHLFSSHIDVLNIGSDEEIFENINGYSISNMAKLAVNALQICRISNETASRILLKIGERFDFSYVSADMLLAQICRSEENFSNFYTSSWNSPHALAWEPFATLLASYYDRTSANKVRKSWETLVQLTDIPENQLFSKARQHRFFNTLYGSSTNTIGSEESFVEYCKLVSNIPRKAGPLENQFFLVFGGLSRSLGDKKKTYFLNLLTDDRRQASPTRKMPQFIATTNEIREHVEASVAKLGESLQNLAKTLSSSAKNRAKILKLKIKFEAIYSDWNALFQITCIHTSKAITGYFEGRHSIPPRVSIKTIRMSGESLVLDTVYRDHTVHYSQSSRVEDNTGFRFALYTGSPYLCNDIKASYKAGIYRNPRLNLLDDETRKQVLSRLKTERGWQSLWTKDEESSAPFTYQSTVIVPINITRPAKDGTIQDLESRSAITAFLCLDHVEANYFNPSMDLPILESGASIIRSYLTTRHSTFVGANTILKVVDRIRDQFQTIRIEGAYGSTEVSTDRLKKSLEEADSESTLSIVDYGLRIETDG